MHCIVNMVETQKTTPTAPKGIVVDASFLNQYLKPGHCTTIGEYIHQVVVSYVRGQLSNYDRVDLVFDEYFDMSLKLDVRSIRGQGEKKRVRLTTKMPRNWASFLRNNDNKK